MSDLSDVVRPPAVAGIFYPEDPRECAEQVDGLLAQASARLVDEGWKSAPKAIIVPHAGWHWSGDLGALAWQTLAPRRRTISRVVVLGPTHRVAIRGVALPAATVFRTPLGDLPVPVQQVLSQTADLPCPVHVDTATHAHEHALEVQVPFIQRVLGDVELVPLNVGPASRGVGADIIEALWGSHETVVAISTDLSHYHDGATARRLDADTVRAISMSGDREGGRVEEAAVIPSDRACGASPLNGLLEVCARRGLRPTLLGAHNSGDVPGGEDTRVVGYAAFAVEEDNHDTSTT
ncbi:MAG: AmmeMemoRadiSam system protein B [Actinomyces sp.]|nr:AmmeMemoRadiSam system protein B [Actinomyces sp.]